MKRIFLLVLTNIAVMVLLTFVVYALGLDRYLYAQGYSVGGLLAFAAVFGFGGAFISLAMSKWTAKRLMGVQVIDPRNPGEFRDIVEQVHRLAQKAALTTMPQVGVYDSPEINAFATGPTRSRALVAVSTGLLQRMDRDAIDGRLASVRDRLAESVMAFVADADPVKRHKYDRLLIVGHDHDAPRGKWIVRACGLGHEAVAQRRTGRRCDIDLERADTEVEGERGHGEQRAPNDQCGPE